LKQRLSSFTAEKRSLDDAIARAIDWARLVHGKASRREALPEQVVPPTQETTGYIIPTLYNLGEKDLAIQLAKWEASCQRPDGAFSAVDGVPYTFDTAQVVRGFLAVLDDVPALEENLRRACDYVESHIAFNGEVCTQSYDTWKFPDGSMLSEYGNLYVLPPMLAAGKKLSEPRYISAARRGLDYFRSKPDLVEFKSELGTLSHYFGYMMEALVDLGETDLAKRGLAQAQSIQKKDGAIPAFPKALWVCSTGLAQLAIAWYKLGDREPADRAIDYLVTLQNPSGGFYGSYGRRGQYSPNREISWAVKFFLDSWLLKNEPNDLFKGSSPIHPRP
jgi:malonyl-CoA O-methyltransferase